MTEYQKLRQPNQDLYGLSFEDLLVKTIAMLDTNQARLAIQPLEELLWRQRRSIDDPDVLAEIAKVTAEREGRTPWKIDPSEMIQDILAWWEQAHRDRKLPTPEELRESDLHEMIHVLWKDAHSG